MSSTVVALNLQGSPRSHAKGASDRRFVFTEARLGALQPVPGRTIIYYDQRSPLAVRATPAGARTYLLYRWAGGRPVKLSLGRVGEVRLEDARREAQRAVATIAAGKDPAAERKAARVQGMTLDELWETWKARRWATLRENTKVGFESCWRVHIRPALGTTAVKKITRADLQRLVDRTTAQGKPGMARHIKALVHLLLVEAVRLDVVAANAGAGVQVPAYVPRGRIILSHEREPLLAAIDAAPEPWADFFNVTMLTGARVSNVCGMRWADLDLDAATWRIPAERSKSKRITVLPLIPDAVAILRRRLTYRAGEPWVFPSSRSATGHVVQPKVPWAEILKKAGIEGLTRHDLRRSLGTTMAKMGAGDRIIAAALGHVSMSAVRVYAQLAGEVARDAVAQAAAVLTARRP
jgi:integrase